MDRSNNIILMNGLPCYQGDKKLDLKIVTIAFPGILPSRDSIAQ